MVTVQPLYLEDQSDPEEGRFVWAYRVRIHNGGTDTVQLVRRTWRITDAAGRTITIGGPGVVGEQPTLEPDETFEYTSGTPLETSSGFMSGLYHMVDTVSGEEFDILIPSFSLDSPDSTRQLH